MEIGDKIKEFGLKKFSSLKDFAEAMKMKPPSLHAYLGPNPKREPGAGILKKLKELGCDINWLLAEDSGPPGIKELPIPYNNLDTKIKKLEQEKAELEAENEHLRSTIAAEISLLTQAVKGRKGKAKKK